MACVSPDGKPTESGLKILNALKARELSPEEISSKTGLPLFRVRSGLRELVSVELINEKEGNFFLTDKGFSYIKNEFK